MSAPLSVGRDATSNASAAGVMLVGVAVAVAAQLLPGVPLAGAVALIAWGTASAVSRRPGLLLLAAGVYAPLGVVAVMAQVDLAMRADSLAWATLAGIDAAIAITVFVALARHTGETLARS